MKLKAFSLIFFVSILSISTTIHAQQAGKTVESTAGNSWSLSFTLGSRLKLAEAPARIIALTGDLKNTVAVKSVDIENLSSKTIVGVKFQWYLYDEAAPEKAVVTGETPIIGIRECLPGKKHSIEYRMATFDKISAPLAKDGVLEGTYTIEVSVKELLYTDDSSWSRG